MPTYDQAAFRTQFERGFTYLGGFLRNVHRYRTHTALTDPLQGRSWTYEELNGECNRLANALAADGVHAGDVVMYQLMNRPEFAFLYLATQKLGAISCPINFRLAGGETAYAIDESQPVVFFYDTAFAETAAGALAAAKHQPKRVLEVGGGAQAPALPGAASFADYVARYPCTDPGIAAPSTFWDETTRLYTSGTTGLPKGVPINNAVEIFTAHDVIMHFPLSPRDRTLNMTPWFHRGGLYSGGPNPVFYVGAEAVILERFDADLVLDYVERYRLTFLIGAPPSLKALHDAQLKRQRDVSSLKGIVTMGAPLEREACIRYQSILTPNIFNGYGTSEAFWNTFLRPYDLPGKAGSAGRSCTDDDVAVVKVYPDRLAEPQDHVAKDGKEVGEVIVRAPSKCSYSYINDAERAARTFHKGWIYIGDLGTWDDDEYVTIVGRKDDMIISGGENVHPVQVEEVLNEHPHVLDSVVVGVPDEQWGEVVTAYVLPRDDAPTPAELERYCSTHPMLARYKRPRLYRIVESLPYTATGKKLHYKIKEQATRDRAAGLLQEP
ncbi:long-chain fatty acid--CoA ligase [bacterium]|nr:MAG: long-chain fatty acid--CoA ligase [bacterium]